MRRSLGFLFLGLILGGLAGYAFRGPAGEKAGQKESAWSSRAENPASPATSRSAEKQRAEDQKILLGDLTTVPFQEVYEILSRQGSDGVTRLAEQLDGLPPSPENTAKIKIFFKAWAQLDSNAAFEKATNLHTSATRGTAIEAVVAGADPTAAGRLAEAIAKLPNETLAETVRADYLGQAVTKWSEVDPAAAARLLGTTPKGLSLNMTVYQVAQRWAARDPAAALAWAQEQPPISFGMNPISGAVLGWWDKEPARAEAFALAQLGTPAGKQLISSLIGRMASSDRAKAVAWVEQLPDPALREQSYSILAGQLAFTDPKAAASWSLTLPAEVVDDTVGSTISLWAQTDPTAAAKWMEGLSGSTRDSALSSYSYVTAENDPAAATAWAATIGDEKKRENALRRTTGQWLERDPAAARAWIQSSSLTEATKSSLLGTPTRRADPVQPPCTGGIIAIGSLG